MRRPRPWERREAAAGVDVRTAYGEPIAKGLTSEQADELLAIQQMHVDEVDAFLARNPSVAAQFDE